MTERHINAAAEFSQSSIDALCVAPIGVSAMSSHNDHSTFRIHDAQSTGREPKRQLVYDATHLTTHLDHVATTGIDAVDRAYARYFSENGRIACGLHYGAFSPHLLSSNRVAELADFPERKFNQISRLEDDENWRSLHAWLTRIDSGRPPAPSMGNRISSLREQVEAAALKMRSRLAHDPPHRVPHGAVYLNIAQYGLEYGRLFEWLDKRRDVVPTFLVHDMLPFDYPEYFRGGYEQTFRRRFETIQRYAQAIIATSNCTAQRIAAEFISQNRRRPPIHVQPLASPLEHVRTLVSSDPKLAASPYFVVLATIEPRKNHLMLFNVWRALVAADANAPKLVCVGQCGWNNADTVGILERSAALRPHVRAITGLSTPALRSLLKNARALLMPSFAEGYGMPLVEALTLGVPAICSDIPVFREVTQGCATYLSPLDGVAWRDTIRRFVSDDRGICEEASKLARAFKAPNRADYFAGIESFLRSL